MSDFQLSRLPWPGIIIINLLLLGMTCIALLQPLVGDDVINMSHVNQAENPFQYILHLLLTYTGRVSTLVILTLGYMSLTTFKILQVIKSFLFFYTAYLICCISLNKNARIFDEDLLFYILVLSGLWFGLTNISFTVTWFTGGIVYLVPACAFLLFLSPFLNFTRQIEAKTEERSDKTPYLSTIKLFLFGFVAGNGHELLAVAGLFLSSTWLIYCYRHKVALKAIPVSMKVGLLGLLIGIGINICAPGSWQRLSLYKGWEAQHPIPQNLFWSFFHFIIQDALTSSLIIWSLCMLLPLILLNPIKSINYRFTMKISATFVLAAFITLFPLLITSRELFAGQHTAFYFSYFIVIACSIAFGAVETPFKKQLEGRQLILTIMVTALMVKPGIRDILGGYQHLIFEKERLEYITNQKSQGVEDIVLPFVSPYFRLYSIREDQLTGPNLMSPVNIALANLYGVRSIAVGVNAPVGPLTSPEILSDIIHGQRFLLYTR